MLRFAFGDPGESRDQLREVSGDGWLDTFDEPRLNFICQEQTKDGSRSNFCRRESPDAKDARPVTKDRGAH